MILRSCAHEKEVAALLASGAWPHAVASDLQAHAAACRPCADLVLVSKAFQAARARSTAAAPLHSPGTLWWRAQLRRRNAAVERVGKPLLGAQIFALVLNLLLVAGFLVAQARSGLSWLPWLQQLPQSALLYIQGFIASTDFTSASSLAVLIPALATLAILSGVLVYFASEKN